MTINELVAFAKANNISMDSDLKLVVSDCLLDSFYFNVEKNDSSGEINIVLPDVGGEDDRDCDCGEFECHYCGG